MNEIHAIFTNCEAIGDSTWSLDSPQLRHLYAGDSNLPRLMSEAGNILRLAGAPAEARVWHHEQRLVVSPAEREFYVRWWADDEEPQSARLRGEAAQRQARAAESGLLDPHLDDMPTMATGERLIIAVAPGDTLGWTLDQLSSDSGGAVVSTYAGDDAVWSCPIFDADREPGRGASLDQLGITRESTIAEVMSAVLAAEAHDLSAHFALASA